MPLNPLNHHYAMENPASVYDEEALTALELAGRTTAKVNEAVQAFNKLEGDTNTHLVNQDEAITKMNDVTMPAKVTAEVQSKIDSGEFDQAISEYAGELGNRVDNLLGAVTVGSTSGDAELIDLRTDVNGSSHTNAGNAVRHQFKSLPVAGPNITQVVDLNTYTTPGSFAIGTTEKMINAPNGLYQRSKNARFLVVECFGWNMSDGVHSYGRQTLYGVSGDIAYQRYYDHLSGSISWTGWRRLPTVANNLDISTACDINNIVEHGVYCVATTEHTNAPSALTGKAFMLETTCFNTQWILQTAYPLYANTGMYYRTGRNKTQSLGNFNEGLTVTWSEWIEVAHQKKVTQLINNAVSELNARIDGLDNTGTNTGYTIVNLGDSIVGNINDNTSISSQLSALTGATVYNCGFGGCQMTLHSQDDWSPFSMCNLADAIASGDFSTQTEKATAGVSGMPAYFIDHVNTLKSLDFSKVDLITIAYGTNDFTSNDLIDTKDGREYDKGYYKGALRHSIETILGAYPNIRIVVCTPMYRLWFENGEILNESDTYKPHDRMLPEYATAVKEVCAEYHLPVCDYYNEMGVNKFNWPVCFTNTDGTHPHAEGRHLMAKKLAKVISAL